MILLDLITSPCNDVELSIQDDFGKRNKWNYINYNVTSPCIWWILSTINGCEFCVKMHSSLAQSHKVSSEKINAAKMGSVNDIFSNEERAALRFCEESTEKVSVSDETFSALKSFFPESAIVEITGVVSTINLWNRIIVGLGF